MNEAEEIILEPESMGLEFLTFRGEARVLGLWRDPYITAVIYAAAEEVSAYLHQTRAADPRNLAELYDQDSDLRLRFPTISDLDNFASDQAVRILRSALGEDFAAEAGGS